METSDGTVRVAGCAGSGSDIKHDGVGNIVDGGAATLNRMERYWSYKSERKGE